MEARKETGTEVGGVERPGTEARRNGGGEMQGSIGQRASAGRAA